MKLCQLGDLSLLSYLFIYLFTYLYQYRLLDIYFILWVGIQYYLTWIFVQIVPALATVSSFVLALVSF